MPTTLTPDVLTSHDAAMARRCKASIDHWLPLLGTGSTSLPVLPEVLDWYEACPYEWRTALDEYLRCTATEYGFVVAPEIVSV